MELPITDLKLASPVRVGATDGNRFPGVTCTLRQNWRAPACLKVKTNSKVFAVSFGWPSASCYWRLLSEAQSISLRAFSNVCKPPSFDETSLIPPGSAPVMRKVRIHHALEMGLVSAIPHWRLSTSARPSCLCFI